MGYNTSYDGRMEFASTVSADQMEVLRNALDDGMDTKDGRCIDLTVEGVPMGIDYDGTEKSYNMDMQLRAVIEYAREHICPEFELHGTFDCHDDYGDNYQIRCDGVEVTVIKGKKPDARVTCPHCECSFTLDEVE